MQDTLLKTARTELRHRALRFFAEHPNETARGVLTGANLVMIRNFGLIVSHRDASGKEPLVDTAFTLSPLGERALALWDADFPRDTPDTGPGVHLEIKAGAGGAEPCDWASILARMYVLWAEKKGFRIEKLAETAGKDVGVLSVSYAIHGQGIEAALEAESGVHRMVRFSPHDPAMRRHTSFALVRVLPICGGEIVHDSQSAERASACEAGWDHQVRSYVLHPHQMVKDLRSGFETEDVAAVLDGGLDAIMFAAKGSGPTHIDGADDGPAP